MYLKSVGIRSLMVLFAVILLMINLACEDFKSEEFQMSALDDAACTQLSDTVFSELTLKPLTDFNQDWADSNVAANIIPILDSLEANDLVLHADGSTAIQIATAADTSWFALRSDFSSIVWYLTESMVVNLMTESGTIQKTSDSTMPFEVAGGCTYLEKGANVPEPLIRSRFKYSASEDRYLIQFIKTEQTRDEADYPIKTSILKNQ